MAYARDGTLHTARARAAVLACWACMIPYLCPEMPKRQREALHSLVKTPLVYTTVALRDWRAFKALGVASVYAPGSYHDSLRLNAVFSRHQPKHSGFVAALAAPTPAR